MHAYSVVITVFCVLSSLLLAGCQKEQPSVVERLSRYTWMPSQVNEGDKKVYQRGEKRNRALYDKMRISIHPDHRMELVDQGGDTTRALWTFDVYRPNRLFYFTDCTYMDLHYVKDREFAFTNNQKAFFVMVPDTAR